MIDEIKKFYGNFQQLQDRVLLTGIIGIWDDRGNHKIYRAENGAVLNWWMSKGTILIQGRPEAARRLEQALVAVAKPNASAETPSKIRLIRRKS